MTARIVEFPAPVSAEENMRAALASFCADGTTSGVPAPIVRAMRSPEASTVATTVAGVPVSVPVQVGRLTPAEIVAAWQQLRGFACRMEAVS